MIEIKDKVLCCGCNACCDICPKNCITYETDIEGFWYPVVNKEKCIDCGLCEKVCPIKHADILKSNDFEKSICYAAENKNINVIFDSTSGGLFSAFSTFMYNNGGFVGGAVFNQDMSVSHYISDNKDDLVRLRSSKYLQSNCIGIYKQIKKLLISGKKVLICGTPCQMAALRLFLEKDYENLIILDFICRGINSPKVWRKYLDSFEERYGSKVVYAKAKSKEYGWHNLTQKVILENGDVYYEPKNISNFMKGYLNTNAYCRQSCYECKFKGFPRIADITLADFWGVEKLGSRFDKNIGTSLVMINSTKGEKFFSNIKSSINFVEVPFDSILKENPALLRSLPLPKINREKFFEDLNTKNFMEISELYINNKKTWKSELKKKIAFVKSIVKHTRLNLSALYKTIKYSGFRNLFHMKGIIFAPYSCVKISRSAKFIINGVCFFGTKEKFSKSKLESRLFMGDNSIFEIKNDISIFYGADIEIFNDAKLVFYGRKFASTYCNIGLTIICAKEIIVGHDVIMGRNVTIRDTNGNHYINTEGYENISPVEIHDKVWLAEHVSVMPGTVIETGCVIGANTLVRNTIPANSLAVGIPAKVVRNDILWKN